MSHTSRRRGSGRRAAAAITAGLLVSGLTAGGAVGAPSQDGHDTYEATVRAAAEGTGGLPAAARTSTVTLVTGDTVSVGKASDGRTSVAVAPAPGRGGMTFQTVTDPDGDIHVYPSDALAGIARNTLDKRLFDVTRLIEDGHGDTKDKAFPVLVSYDDEPSRSTLRDRADALPASTTGVVLDRTDMASLRVDKKRAASFWKAARPQTPAAGKARAATGSGVAKVWYDAPAKVALDVSVPQIHAPEAWAAGLDGKGVKVAVLDTGIDPNHADVKDRVVGSKSFVDTSTVRDGHGHGTHVASTIAGSGAASGGRYKGVAPGADLLIGKVLDDNGRGPISGIIAGMEWAVAQGADVISMSLGSDDATADSPDTLAVDRLSASSDSLFVIAAGNTGPGASTVGSPGAADSALTVGAVDKSDRLADFSSRGPLGYDGAVKPDITAPGVGIVAARAAGTAMGTPVDDDYTAANGTSMATPHVAGAAAILAQRHPDWSGERIKAELVSHTKPSAGTSVYEQGNGRVDIAASLDAKVDLSGSLDYGMIWYPGQDTPYEPETRTLTVSNPTDAATTVTLAATTAKGDLPQGALTLGDTTVSVPAGGSVDVKAVLDPNGLATGTYEGEITATTADGATARTVIGFIKEAERFGATLTLKDRDGGVPDAGLVVVMGLDNDTYETYQPENGVVRARLLAGRYAIFGGITTGDQGYWGSFADATDLFSLPDTTVGKKGVVGLDLTVDARTTRDTRVDVTNEQRPLAASTGARQLTWTAPDGRRAGLVTQADLSSSSTRMGLIPTTRPKLGTLTASVYQRQREPLLTARVTGTGGFTLDTRVPGNLARFEGTKTLPVVDAGGGSAEELAGKDLRGKAVLFRDDHLMAAGETLQRIAEAGAAAALGAPASEREQWVENSADVGIPFAGVSHADGGKLAARVAAAARTGGEVTIALKGVKESGYAYSGRWDFPGTGPSDGLIKAKRQDFAKVRNVFHSYGRQRLGTYAQNVWSEAAGAIAFEQPERVLLGTERDDYLLAGNGLTYQQTVSPTDLLSQMFGKVASYRAGQKTTEDWFGPALHAAPKGSALFDACNFCSTDLIVLPFPGMGGDSDPDHYTQVGTLPTEMYFEHDGKKITDADWKITEKGTYTFVLELPFTAAEGYADGITSRAAYTFTTGAPRTLSVPGCAELLPQVSACEALPVVLTHYTVPVDLLNRASADRPFDFTLDGYRAKGYTGSTRLAGAKVSLSYDGGTTWQPAKVSRTDGDSFKVAYKHPALSATDGHVAVRTELWDDAGNRTVETVTRAYDLK
ncbi:S8 family serine peptidase [Streptomyces laurentii]|uniref:S8 family serine peptidase n=1 Tax=Streptomyces laurentii TaxID=39478 RepID=UPI00368EF4F1